MLALPAKHFHRSAKRHNVDLGVCCDWIEASVLFLNETITATDIVDVLCENEIYRNQSFAWEFVNDVTLNIRERTRLIGESYPIQITSATRFEARDTWPAYAAYSFCLLLSLASCYPQWSQSFGQDYTEQGELFELLTAESVRRSLVGWMVHPTGWTRTAPRSLGRVVERAASVLGEATGDLGRWGRQRAKEAGLDLLCFRPFPDGRVGQPVYLVQCASGADWTQKRKTPDLDIWTKLIVFSARPRKAFSMPFALSNDDFRYHTAVVDGLLLDRYRLLFAGQEDREWLASGLVDRLVAWSSPRVSVLPALVGTLQ